MPAPNSLTPLDSADDRVGHEPSMEEILASIRRIISDDQSLTQARDYGRSDNGSNSAPETPTASPKWPHASTHREEPPRAETVDAQMSNTTPNQADRGRVASSIKQAPPDAPQFFSRQAETKHSEPKSSDFIDLGLRQQAVDTEAGTLLKPVLRRSLEPIAATHEEAPIVSAATDAAVATSFNALFASQLLPNSETLAEMARDMLRPMLKAWLDDNLPVMVERLVRAEIERVARGGR